MAAAVMTPPRSFQDKPSGGVKGKRQQCNCCPYGYHIDLDFVRYCESITNSQLMPDSARRRSRWNYRKKRASTREALLGLESIPYLMNETAQTRASQEVGDDLERAVMDFEKTLINASLPRKTAHDRNEWMTSTNNYYEPQDKENARSPPYIVCKKERADTPKIQNIDEIMFNGANNASAVTLQNIREQMAASLSRMRELEDQTKTIPGLKDLISSLKAENDQLRKVMKENQSMTSIEKEKAEAFTSTNDLNHWRTVGVGCTVLTRGLGVQTSTVSSKSIGTATESVEEEPPIVKVSSTDSVSLNKIIGPPHLFKLKNAFTCTDLTLNDLFSDRELKSLTGAKPTRNSAVSTDLLHSQIFTSDDLARELESAEIRSKKPCKNASTLTTLQNRDVMTREDVDRAVKLSVEKNTTSPSLARKLLTSVGCQVTALTVQRKSLGVQVKWNSCEVGVSAAPNRFNAATQSNISKRDIGVSEDTTQIHCTKCDAPKTSFGTMTVPVFEPPLVKTASDTTAKLLIKAKSVTVGTATDLRSSIGREASTNTTTNKMIDSSVETGSDFPCRCVDRSSLPRPSPTSTPTSPAKRPSYLPVSVNRAKPVSPRAVRAPSRLRNEGSNSDSGSDDGAHSAVQNAADDDPKIDAYFPPHASNKGNYNKTEPSKEMRGAMKVLNDALQKSPTGDVPKHMKTAVNIVQQEWFKISSVAQANPLDVEDYLDCFEEVSTTLLEYIVNMTDVTGNTAMHYAVSNGNFDVVSILLDSKVCNINRLNAAGYTCIMLVALTEVKSETDREVVRRLFHMADVNIRAQEHGQTALMLAVSHGRIDTVELLLEAGADINIQDEDGSTALMCAAEHGYIEIVKLLLAQPDCDLSITDYDGSTALAIAMEAGNRDIGVLLYAQEHFSRGGSPYPTLKLKRSKSTTPTFKSSRPTTPSHSSHKKDLDSGEH